MKEIHWSRKARSMCRVKKIVHVMMILMMMSLVWMMPTWAAEKTAFDQVQEVRWDEHENGLVRWNKVENAKLYEVWLYREEMLAKKVEVSTNRVNLLEYMEDNEVYTVSVRAIPKTSQKTFKAGAWGNSEEWMATGVGDTSGRFRVYRGGTKYQLEDRTYAANQWKLIQSCWYYFDESGYMKTGWTQVDQKWYYLGTDGRMQTGWLQLEENWYYLKADGSMHTGWIEYQPGVWYYLDASGKMLVNTVIEGHQLDANGVMVN